MDWTDKSLPKKQTKAARRPGNVECIPKDHSPRVWSPPFPPNLIASEKTKSVSQVRSSPSTPHHSPLLKPRSLCLPDILYFPPSSRSRQLRTAPIFQQNISPLNPNSLIFPHPICPPPLQCWSPHPVPSPRILPKSPISGSWPSHPLSCSSFIPLRLQLPPSLPHPSPGTGSHSQLRPSPTSPSERPPHLNAAAAVPEAERCCRRPASLARSLLSS